MAHLFVVRGWMVVAAAALVISGCGSGEDRVSVSKTTGTLVWEGHSVQGLLVVFHPIDPSAPKVPVQPTGVVHKDGRFEVTCYNTADGAPAGDYVVTIREAPRADGALKPTLPPAIYLDHKKSPLRATIENKSLNELAPLVIGK